MSPSHTALTWKRNRYTATEGEESEVRTQGDEWKREQQRKHRGRMEKEEAEVEEDKGWNKEEVWKLEAEEKKTRGGWEMPDGGSQTQHEWWQITEGRTSGREKYHDQEQQDERRGMTCVWWDDYRGRLSLQLLFLSVSWQWSGSTSYCSPLLEMSLARSWFRLLRSFASSWSWL